MREGSVVATAHTSCAYNEITNNHFQIMIVCKQAFSQNDYLQISNFSKMIIYKQSFILKGLFTNKHFSTNDYL
jgi:hypothetical protein